MLILNYTLLRAISQVRQNVSILSRPMLAGIYFEPRLGLATATDGHRLMTGKVSEEEDSDPFIWIPASALPAWHGSAVLENNILKAGAKLVAGDGSFPVSQYPNYRMVLPEDTEGTKVSFNPALLADVQKALGADGVNMQWKDGAILVTFRGVDVPDYSFYLMPMRD